MGRHPRVSQNLEGELTQFLRKAESNNQKTTEFSLENNGSNKRWGSQLLPYTVVSIGIELNSLELYALKHTGSPANNADWRSASKFAAGETNARGYDR
jgi:hypothetical protein